MLRALTALCYFFSIASFITYAMAFHGILPSVYVSTDAFQYLVGQPVLITVTYVHPTTDITTPHTHSVVVDVVGIRIAAWNTAGGLSKTVVWVGTEPGSYVIRTCSFRVTYSVPTQEDCDQKQVIVAPPPKEAPPATTTATATITMVAPTIVPPIPQIVTVERTSVATYTTFVSDNTVGYGLMALGLGIAFAGLAIARSLSDRQRRR